MKIIFEDSTMEKPDGCCDCPYAEWKWIWITCLIRRETKEDKGKNFSFKCPIFEDNYFE